MKEQPVTCGDFTRHKKVAAQNLISEIMRSQGLECEVLAQISQGKPGKLKYTKNTLKKKGVRQA